MNSKSLNKPKGFSLIELLVTVAIISVLTVVATVTIQSVKEKSLNNKVLDDLVAVANALEQYKQDHFNKNYPVPSPGSNQNINCYYADATYAHDCDAAEFRQGFIDNALLAKRYLSEVPTDPRTGSRYVYGVTQDGQYFQVAGIILRNDGTFEARTVDNLAKGFELPSLIRAYDGPNFVMNRGTNLPYNSNTKILTAQLDNVQGAVMVNGGAKSLDDVIFQGDIVTTENDGISSVDIYLSDGSITHLDPGSTLELSHLEVAKNNSDGIVTRVWLKVTSGTVWNKVVRLSQNSEFNVETSGAIAGSRGTEFAVDADQQKIILISGKVEVQKGVLGGALTGDPTSLTVTTTPLSLSVSGTLPTSGTPITGGEDMTRIQNHQTPDFHSMLVPYGIRIDRASASQPWIIFSIGFNGPTSSNYEDLEGFELYTKDQTETPWLLRPNQNPQYRITSKVDSITGPNQYRYNSVSQIYEVSLSLSAFVDGSRYTAPPFVLRAFGHGVYTQLSFNPVNFSIPQNRTLAADLSEPYFFSGQVPDATPGNGTLSSITISGPSSVVSNGTSYLYSAAGIYSNGATAVLNECSWNLAGAQGSSPAGGTTYSYNPATDFEGNVTLTCQTGQASGSMVISVYKPAPLNLCGNGVINQGELCDGAGMGTATCDSVLGLGYTGTLTCSSSCNAYITTACIAPTCPVLPANAHWTDETYPACTWTCDASYTKQGDVCIPTITLQSICTGTGKFWDGTACWVLGSAGANCTDTCNALDGAGLDVMCGTDLWNDTASYTVCSALVPGGTNSTLTNTFSTNYIAPYKVPGVNQCKRRNDAPTPTVNQPALCSNTGSTEQRLCKCQ